jgi:hypothetical protein
LFKAQENVIFWPYKDCVKDKCRLMVQDTRTKMNIIPMNQNSNRNKKDGASRLGVSLKNKAEAYYFPYIRIDVVLFNRQHPSLSMA